MMPKKISGIEGSDRDDANEVTDVASGNDEEVNSEENENKDDGEEVDNEDKDDGEEVDNEDKDDGEEVDNEDKDDGEEVGQESAVPRFFSIFTDFRGKIRVTLKNDTLKWA